MVDRTRGPRPARHQTVQFWKIGLRDWFTPVAQARHSLEIVAETLEIVSGDYLLVHVVEQLASAVFVDDFSGTVEGIDEVPVPMMDVRADVFAEVRDAMLIVQI